MLLSVIAGRLELLVKTLGESIARLDNPLVSVTPRMSDFDGVAMAQFNVPGRGPVQLEYAMLRERAPQLRREILMTATGKPRVYEPEDVDELSLDAWEEE